MADTGDVLKSLSKESSFPPQSIIKQILASGIPDELRAFSNTFREQIYDSVKGPTSQMLSAYHAQHVFIRCPVCGSDYPINDPEVVEKQLNLYECYKQRRGKDCEVQCNQIHTQEYEEKIRRITKDAEPPCTHKFTVHEGLIEYKAQTAIEWFARGSYTQVEEGFIDLKAGQAMQPELRLKFSWIDYVILYPKQSSSANNVKTQWYRTGNKLDKFVILTSVENEEDLGKPVRVNWQVVGLRKLSDKEKLEMQSEQWKRFLLSSARKLLYEHDPKMSILESWSAFELFLDMFIEDNWETPHLKENRNYLQHVAGFSTETKIRILLHESLGIPFVQSEVWKDWAWTKTFRNQIAHGGRLQDTKYGEHGKKKKIIGDKLENDTAIAKFCYRSTVRAIYFIRYWKI